MPLGSIPGALVGIGRIGAGQRRAGALCLHCDGSKNNVGGINSGRLGRVIDQITSLACATKKVVCAYNYPIGQTAQTAGSKSLAGAESKAKREELISAPEAKIVFASAVYLAIYQIDFNFGSTAKREESVPLMDPSSALMTPPNI